MYRKFTITDEAGKEIEMEVYPDLKNLVKTTKREINMELATESDLLSLISVVNRFMGGNTINKVEIEEIT